MNGAECLLRTLLANGIDLCFMNPGTSEMQFVSMLDRIPEMRGVLGLFEGVCSGAADGYARMARKPAATLLHLGPGLANSLSNLHNARKARSPVVNIVGEHSTQHLRYDAPLSSDTAAFARTVSGWVCAVDRAGRMGEAASAAVAAAVEPPGQVASLIVPADFSWSEAGEPGPTCPRPSQRLPAREKIRDAARILRSGEPAALLLSGSAVFGRGLEAARRVHAAFGVRVFADRNAARRERGRGVFPAERIPYFPEPAQALLAGLKHLILVEARPPVSFFGYPGVRSSLAPEDCAFETLAEVDEDGPAALEWLAGEGGIDSGGYVVDEPQPAVLPHGEPFTAAAVGRTVSSLLPEGAIISDESVSLNQDLWQQLGSAARHDYLPVTGGSIGQGLPVAVGAALARPGRKVIALEADGSGMYTLQALWTMAREHLDITVIILGNRRYGILDIEMRRTGAAAIGPRANDLLDLTRPDLNWVKLAEAMGVEAARATTSDELIREFRAAMNHAGPRLIEAVLSS
jgi:acetolactate synthase-1/2/3 large subunit